MTKVDPASPMKRRTKMRPVRLFTRPIQAVGILANIKTMPTVF